MTYNLSDDICRCHDGACPKHGHCLRWLGRKDDVLQHEFTLRNGMSCDSFMPNEPDAPFCGCGD